MSRSVPDMKELSESFASLQNERLSLLLSTLNADQEPEISYAPFLKQGANEFYIFISDLATHSQNLRLNPKASIMLIADESETQNIYARERLTFQCQAEEMDKQQKENAVILDLMESRFGNIFGMLKTLNDFRLIRLTAVKGSYVVGFGRAYDVNPATGELEHVSEEKVRQKKEG